MNFNTELLFFFSALGCFNGIILGTYFLFFAKPKHISNYFLGAMLIVLSIRVGKSVFFYFNQELSGLFLQIGITACFFIGPFLFFYNKSILQPHGKIKKYWKYHMLVLVPVILFLGIKYPYVSNLELWKTLMNFVYLEWFVYILASGFLLKHLLKKMLRRNQKMSSLEIWMMNVFLGNLTIWVAYFSSHYTSYIVGALSFTFISYLLALFFVFSKRKHSILYKNAVKYSERKIDNSQVAILSDKLHQLMENKELFKNPNLKSVDVANELNISLHQFSQLLNENLGKNFSKLVNEYRIEKAKSIIQSDHNYTLEGIGQECGFNSKSTFYAAFKRNTGTTPSNFV